MASNGFFNEIIKEVNQFVTVPKASRNETTTCYNALIEALKTEMKKDPLFDRLFNGVKLAGSYVDGLKVSNADEYDTNFILKFPMNYCNEIEVREAGVKHGYITINIKKGLNVLQKSSCKDHNMLLLARFFDDKGFLLQDGVKAWMQSVLQSVLNRLPRANQEFIIKAGRYNCYVKDTQSGPALTLNVRVPNTNISFSLDLVAAFCFGRQQWISKRQPPSHIQDFQWLGVPKPDKKILTDNRFFVASYAQIEREYLSNKHSLKNLIRLFKKIRDTKKYTNLKSYYIKMIFLWVIDTQPTSYWNKPVGVIFLEMFDVLLNHLKEGKLLFFWDTRQNLFSDFKPQQLVSLHGQLQAEQKKLLMAITNKDRNAVLSLFLTESEKKLMQAIGVQPPVKNGAIIAPVVKPEEKGGSCILS